MKKVFYSFHYALDNWRANQIRNMGVVEGQRKCEPNEWEDIKRKGDKNIAKWIDSSMQDCDCVIVLIGEQTHTRKWIKYEVKKAKELNKPIFAIFIHKLKDSNSKTSKKGKNVFGIKAYEAKDFSHISKNLESWIDENTLDKKLLLFGISAFMILLFHKQIKSFWNHLLSESVAKNNARFS